MGGNLVTIGSKEGNTTLRHFDISNDGQLNQTSSQKLIGDVHSARAVDQRLMIISESSLFPYQLTDGFYRFNNVYKDLDYSSYRELALRKFSEVVLPWVDGILENYFNDTEGTIDQAALKKTIRLFRMMTTGESDNDSSLMMEGHFINTFIRVSALTISQGKVHQQESWTTFSPAGMTDKIYSDGDTLIIPFHGHQEHDQSYNSVTHLMGFDWKETGVKPSFTTTVNGSLLGPFSLDIHEGHMRIVTTLDEQWSVSDSGIWNLSTDSSAQLQVYDINSQTPQLTGELTGLGLGQRVYAVRFEEKRAFVVTFEVTDPFYTIDLSDHSKPLLVGELEIPGFSSYLHPIGDDLIIGIGREDGKTLMSLFDVSDFSDPLQIHKSTFEGSTQAAYDHKAFRWISSANQLVIPYASNRF
jgi:hypothetical protein